ncbi:MAG: hypothetical protein ABI867_20820 [Kofleriaceae bacterium]
MSEFFGFYATRLAGPVDRAKLKAALKKLKANAVITEGKTWLYVNSANRKAAGFANTVIHYFDHEGSAWDFDVYVAGKRIGGGIFGENVETGAEDQGFEGDLAATAKALAVDPKKLEKTFATDSKKFFKLLGLEWMAAPETESEIPKGQHFFDELDG